MVNNPYNGPLESSDSDTPVSSLKKLVALANQIAGNGSGDSGDTTVLAVPVDDVAQRTPNPFAMAASQSVTVPSGARSYSFVLLTGTGTMQPGSGAAVAVPLGVPINGSGLAASLTFATGASSSAFLLYETTVS